MFQKLIKAAKLHDDADKDSLADTIWLAMCMATPNPDHTGADAAPAMPPSAPKLADVAAKPDATEVNQSGEMERNDDGQTPIAAGRPKDAGHKNDPSKQKWIGALPTLPDKQQFRKALRAFRTPAPQNTSEIDETETAEQYARQGGGHLAPVMQKGTRRWLKVRLLAETGGSNALWTQALDELEGILWQQGSFRAVKREPLPVVATACNWWKNEIIIVASDFTSDGWWDGHYPQLLRKWSITQPLLLMHTLPSRLWARSWTGVPDAFATASTAAQPTQALLIKLDPAQLEFETPPSRLAFPLIGMEPIGFANWSSALMQSWATRMPAILFALRNTLAFSDADNIEEAALPRNAEETVMAFKMTASPLARKLAQYMAVTAPLNFPVMRWVQQAMLSESNSSHLAEFVLGGLLERGEGDADTEADAVRYDFADGVRPLLQLGMPISHAMEVLQIVGAYLEANDGSGLKLRTAVETMGESGFHALSDELKAFALVSRDFMRRIGLVDGGLYLGRGGKGQTVKGDANPVGVSILPPFVESALTVAEDKKNIASNEDGTVAAGEESMLQPSYKSPSHPQSSPPIVILFTVTAIETNAVLDVFLGKSTPLIPLSHSGVNYNELGLHGGNHVIHATCNMGSDGEGGSHQRVAAAIDHWQPSAVISVGTAFGIDETKQKIGDVLVAEAIQSYEVHRGNNGHFAKHGDRWRGAHRLLSGVRHAEAVQQNSQIEWPKLHFGTILAGEWLVDNQKFIEHIKSLFDDLVGGEMEGVGIATRATAGQIDWLVIKGISDWGHSRKLVDRKASQALAAKNAAKVAHMFLSMPGLYVDAIEPVPLLDWHKGDAPLAWEDPINVLCRHLGDDISNGKFPDIFLKISSKIEDGALELNIEADSAQYYEPEIGEIIVDKISVSDGLQPLVPLDIDDGVLRASLNVDVVLSITGYFSFSVNDYIDKDMVDVGNASLVEQVQLKLDVFIDFDVENINEKIVLDIQLQKKSVTIDFGNIEPDFGDEDDFANEDDVPLIGQKKGGGEDEFDLRGISDGPPSNSGVWLFAYSSLIYKVDFPFVERRRASIKDWARRFWLGSHDHRGTVAAPGRVVMLIPAFGSVCDGMAYLVTRDVFEHLDHREKNGYVRLDIKIQFEDKSCVPGLVYIASAQHPAFLGVASERVIARQIMESEGASGPNRDYLLCLASALRELGAIDPHVFEIEHHLLEMDAVRDPGSG